MIPTRKITAAVLGGAVVTIAVWLIPGEEPSAVVGALTTLAAFAFGWLTTESA